MKKTNLLILPILAASLLTGCNGDKGGEEQKTDPTQLTYKDLGSEFNKKYYPVMESIDQTYAGKITVALVFEGKENAWKALANEYSRLHDGAVTVEINSNFGADSYQDKLKSVLQSANPEWNVIQGNLMGDLKKEDYTVSFNNLLSAKNPYAGNKFWEDDLLTKDAVDSTNKYIVNSENLQTAWFVNTVAKQAAIAQGYKTEQGDTSNPKTWVDLINLLESLQKAGYTYPLGLSLDKDSINSTQFSWLLRVYGDYYYRNEYTNIAESYGSYTVDVTAKNPESGFKYSVTRLFNSILDTSSTKYVGAQSEKFKEFVSMIGELGKYVNPNNINSSFSQVRNVFSTQSNGNSSPQVMMDYLGSGLGFIDRKSDKYDIDFFDNPVPKSEGGFVLDNTLLRDVGGNGGYLSIARHNDGSNIDNIAADFVRFVMSPYGQTIYYDALAQSNVYPQGITTVKNSYVVIPTKWKQFFSSTDKVSFSGQSDKNPFISFLIRYMSTSGERTTSNAKQYWGKLLTDSGYDVTNFSNDWDSDINYDWDKYAESQHFDVDCYMHPGGKTTGPWDD